MNLKFTLLFKSALLLGPKETLFGPDVDNVRATSLNLNRFGQEILPSPSGKNLTGTGTKTCKTAFHPRAYLLVVFLPNAFIELPLAVAVVLAFFAGGSSDAADAEAATLALATELATLVSVGSVSSCNGVAEVDGWR